MAFDSVWVVWVGHTRIQDLFLKDILHIRIGIGIGIDTVCDGTRSSSAWL